MNYEKATLDDPSGFDTHFQSFCLGVSTLLFMLSNLILSYRAFNMRPIDGGSFDMLLKSSVEDYAPYSVILIKPKALKFRYFSLYVEVLGA